jgi:TRAP-type transport system small permease protein
MSFLSFDGVVKRLSKALYHVGAVFLFALMLLSSADMIGRFFFNLPIVGALEISQILVAAMVFLGWGQTQIQKGNITVELLYARFPPRMKTVATLVTTVLSAAVFGLMTWQALLAAKQYHDAGRVIFVINLPLGPFQLFVVLGALMMFIVLIIEIWKITRQRKEEPSR